MPPTPAPLRSAREVPAQIAAKASLPSTKVAISRAEAEAEARLQGMKRVEKQLAQQRAESEAVTVLERGLEVTVSAAIGEIDADGRI